VCWGIQEVPVRFYSFLVAPKRRPLRLNVAQVYKASSQATCGNIAGGDTAGGNMAGGNIAGREHSGQIENPITSPQIQGRRNGRNGWTR
jgi:hypothetical protein